MRLWPGECDTRPDRIRRAGTDPGPGNFCEGLSKPTDSCRSSCYGPPGVGKTALAHLIAERSSAVLSRSNAVTRVLPNPGSHTRGRAGTGARQQEDPYSLSRKSTGFTRVQQGRASSDVERGNITLIGASTQNPFFAIIPALSSRSRFSNSSRLAMKTYSR